MSDLTAPKRAGHVLAIGVTAVNALGGLVTAPSSGSDSGPPAVVVVIGLLVGVVVTALLVVSWRQDRVGPRRVAAVLMVVVALTAVPAFLVGGVPAGVQLVAGAVILATLVAVVLLFYPDRGTSPA